MKTSDTHQEEVIAAIRKKLQGATLTYEEIYKVMSAISHHELGDILITYFAASGYTQGFTNKELYFLTRAMIETGHRLHFDGIVADKHSIGGIPGNRTTLVVVPIIAAAGFTIPKSSSRAITTPSGTADNMEVLAPVEFSKQQIYTIVKKTKACIVWGGSFNIAPADDEIIKVEEPLLFESYDKILVSIMAKKIAFGATHILIDIPYGKTAKVTTKKDAEKLEEKFLYLSSQFGVKTHCLVHKIDQPSGNGIGPLLETRDALRVLQQKQNRPKELEEKSLTIATLLLELCLKDTDKETQERVKKDFGSCSEWAKTLLTKGIAFEKMQEIIDEQGGNAVIDSEDLVPGKHKKKVVAHTKGIISQINLKNATITTKILGAPKQKGSGLYLEKKIGEEVMRGETLYTMYSESAYHLKEAIDSITSFPIYTI